MSGSKPSEAADDPIDAQAALWVVRLASPDATAADRAAFEAWRAADPAHAQAYATMAAWRRTMGGASDAARGRGAKRTRDGLLALAVLGLACVLGDRFGLVDRFRADIRTGIGAITAATLPDGSRVDLNSDTALALHFTSEERAITLLRGEAAFDVAADARRPFVVRGAAISARALGTRFYVRADGEADPAGVVEGRIDVTTPAGHTTLRAGQTASHDRNGHLVGRAGDVAQALAWREGKLVVSGRPLTAVLTELERYRYGRIVLIAPGFGGRRFSGTLDLRDTDAALDVLCAAMGLRLVRLTPLLVLVRPAA